MAKWKKAEIERLSKDYSDVGEAKRGDGMLKRPMFQISPDQAVLLPYQSQNVVITAYSDIAQEVKERLLCHAIIGRNPHKERIMTVDIVCLFIAPLLEFSTKEVTFRMEQEPDSLLERHVHDMLLKNVSPLPLTALLSCSYPFRLSLSQDEPFTANQMLSLGSSEEAVLSVQYDSSYCVDRQSRNESQTIEIAYKEHPQKDYINLLAEIHFPNIHFSTTKVDFGCVLNNTEVMEVVRMTNNSPLVVNYRWYFLKGAPTRRDPLHDDEGVDMQSEIETDSIEGSSSSIDEQQQPEGEGGAVTPPINVVDVEESPRPSEGEKEEDEGSLKGVGVHVSRKQRESIGFELRVTPEFLAAEKISVHVTAPSVTESQTEDINRTEGVGEDIRGNSEVPVVISQSLPPSEHSESTVEVTEEEEEEVEEEEEERERQPWEMVGEPLQPVSIRQIFDILPLFGVLQPGETQDVEMSFFGHTDVSTEVRAVCKVEGGPVYELVLAGEASDIQYRINKKKIRLGIVPYDSLCCEEITLSNIGKVALDFKVLGAVDGEQLEPGQFSVSPTQVSRKTIYYFCIT
uniref:MSP domain-containing protein n=1 Tax=Amphimedon queenslandica TaxID=400682 RepID=A0A1X7TBB6_AMPQE